MRQQRSNFDNFSACINSSGLYNSVQNVLRLSPEIHRRLAALGNGGLVRTSDPDTIEALGVYLHETVHWWQHIGSTAGFILSLSHPAQAYVNYAHLKFLLSTIGPHKSIRRWLSETPRHGGPDTPAGHANTVVNNYYDIDFFRRLIVSPGSASEFINSNLFESVGHSYSIAYANITSLLANTIGDTEGVFPNARLWEPELAKLRKSRASGFYRGGEIRLAPLGARALFEGQARFIQLQFLKSAAPHLWNWELARSRGLLRGVYVEAFEAFLSLTGFEWPPEIDHQTIGLFLLVCDLAINPGAGFPLSLRFPQSFLPDVDPGMRFLFLCRALVKTVGSSQRVVKQYSKEEYRSLSDDLSDVLMLDSPSAIVETVAAWPQQSASIRALLKGHNKAIYGAENLSVRLLLAHFVTFTQDKMARPQLFCWPGVWMVGESTDSEIESIIERQAAPFVDKADSDGIYPRQRRGLDETVVHEAFTSFYAVNIVCDMTRQWIVEPGPFRYNYDWLADTSSTDMKSFGDRHFEQVFGVHPDRFSVA